MIKLTKFVLVLSLAVLINACGSDDEMTTTSTDLEGDWTALTFTAETSTSTAGVQAAGTTIEASNLAYDLTFTSDAFTTSGGYDLEVKASAAGAVVSTTNDTYSNIMGQGTYSTSGNQLAIDGSFFDFSAAGSDLSAFGGAQTVTYEIGSNGNLTVTQNEETETTVLGITTKSTIISTSTWEKK